MNDCIALLPAPWDAAIDAGADTGETSYYLR
jgi:hypothetical protein